MIDRCFGCLEQKELSNDTESGHDGLCEECVDILRFNERQKWWDSLSDREKEDLIRHA